MIESACDFDAIVIGAGPAGSLAALGLARRGHAVLLVERESWPRHKTCGGCISGSAIAALNTFGLSDLPRTLEAVPLQRLDLRIHGVNARVDWRGGLALSRRSLDEGLVQAATRAGVQFLPKTRASVREATPIGRVVALHDSSGRERLIQGRVVVAADGIGGSSAPNDAPVEWTLARRNLVGVGAVAPSAESSLASHCLRMIADRQGYVGMVRVEGDAICIAAALTPASIRQAGGVDARVREMLAAASVEAISTEMRWKGSPQLTRRRRTVAAERLLFAGDASSYVEPLTGEGIGWSMWSGADVVPLADEGIRAWTPSIEQRWQRMTTTTRRRRQLMCRVLTRAIRQPTLSRLAVRALSTQPFLINTLTWSRQASLGASRWSPAR